MSSDDKVQRLTAGFLNSLTPDEVEQLDPALFDTLTVDEIRLLKRCALEPLLPQHLRAFNAEAVAALSYDEFEEVRHRLSLASWCIVRHHPIWRMRLHPDYE